MHLEDAFINKRFIRLKQSVKKSVYDTFLDSWYYQLSLTIKMQNEGSKFESDKIRGIVQDIES